MEAELISVVCIVVGLALFFLYLVYIKKKKPEEAIEEVVDYAVEHKDELLALSKEDLFAMSASEVEEMCGSLGLPIEGSKADSIVKILDYIETLR